MFKGCGTAIVTPFHKDLTVNEDALRRLVRRQIDGGMDFIVPCGTTGENPTLSRKEHLRVIEVTVEEANGKIPVIGGAGGYNTAEVIELGREVKAIGANGLLSVSPYYNKPTQEGLFQHYQAIAAAVKLPIIVYNVPARTGVNIEPATIKRLAALEYLVGVKEASGNIAQISSIVAQTPASFSVLSGDDALALPVIAVGGKGCISTAGNEIPAEMAALVHAALNDDYTAARNLQKKYLPLLEINFVESNPIPVKAAMALMGLIDPVWRLPLVAPKPENLARIEKVLESLGLIQAHAAY